MNYDFSELIEEEKILSVMIDVLKDNGKYESYTGMIINQGVDFVELNTNVNGKGAWEKVIISKDFIKSIWIYKKTTGYLNKNRKKVVLKEKEYKEKL